MSINCPHTAETRGMIGAREYALMQPHAYFINTARGGDHDEAALADALHARQIAGADLDVWEDEPPVTDHPLLRFDNVLVSPHIAGITRQSRHNIVKIAAEKLMVGGAHYFTVGGPLPTTREHEAPPSRHVVDMVEASAIREPIAVGD